MANIKKDVLLTGIWYMPEHGVWITAGADYTLRALVIGNPRVSEREKVRLETTIWRSHTNKIMEVVEITSPKLVASCSLDGTIKLWDLTEREPASELNDISTARGIRGITYSFDFGGNLLSYGFSNHINVWCPEVSLTRSYIGKLEGHASTIVCCKFIAGAPNAVSVDDKANIRIWDIRTLSAI